MRHRRGAWHLGPLGVILVPFLLLLVLILLPARCAYRMTLYVLVWAMWLPRGKDVLFVSSNSPSKSEYMAVNILPHVRQRAVVLNWSERSTWKRWSLPASVFCHFAGSRDHTPIVLFFRPLKRVKKFRFFPAFKERRRGNSEPLETLRGDLLSTL